MVDSREHEENGEHQDLHNLNEVPTAQPPAQAGALSADEPNQNNALTADSSGSKVTAGNVIDSSNLIGSQYQEEDTPALPPRPPTTTTDSTTMVDHVGDVLEPPASNAPAAQHPNPIVAQLKGMFPDFDEALLESVLESVDNNQDAAVDVLLGMSDPSYVSSHQPSRPEPTVANPSLELDEALARQLMLEDQRQVSDRRSSRSNSQSWPRRSADGREDVPYATRSSGPNYAAPTGSPPPVQGQGQGGDFKETFNQIAESGKRTFNTIFSRVKAKINEFEASRAAGTPPPEHPPPSWGVDSSPRQPVSPPRDQALSAAAIPSYYAEEPTSTNTAKMDRHTASQYYGSDSGEDGWRRVGSGGRSRDVSMPVPAPTQASYRPTAPLAPPTHPETEVKGYDVDDEDLPLAAPTAAPSAAPVKSEQPAADAAPRPPTTQSGSPLNAAKFGLLPKRPVSLLRPESSVQAPQDDDEDEDELDYIENPFEESRK